MEKMVRSSGSSSVGGEVIIPFAAMVMVECAQVGLTTLSKAAMSKGMSPYVFVVYYHALGTLILLLPTLFYHKKTPTPLTFSIICKLFFLGLIGSSALMFGLTGIDYSSPTLSSAISNLVPAFTFILAIIFRMEKMDLRSIRGQAKSLGAIISITGAFIVTLYKGLPIIIFSPSTHDHQLNLSVLSPTKSNWVLGGFFLAIDWLLISIYYIFQASILKEYPAEQSVVFFYSLFVTIQSAVVTLIIESDLSVWRLRPDIELFSIIYSGIFGSVVTGVVHTWAMCRKGPFYVAMFKPMGIVIAVIMGVLFLGDTLHIGSVVGSVIISIGFYGVMWGKAADEEEEKVVAIEGNNEANILDLEHSSSIQRVPLLQNHKASL